METKRKASKLKEKAKKIVVDWLKQASSHGLPNAVRAKTKFMRTMWLVFFLFLLVACCIEINLGLKEYFKYQTTLSVKLFRESPTDFPAVTFCNLNPFNELRALTFMKDVLDGPRDTLVANRSNYSMAQVNNNHMKIIKRRMLNANISSRERSSYGFTIDEMLTYCEFNSKPCSTRDFLCYWHSEYGNCCTFNSGKNSKPLQTNKAGPNYGLKMELLVRKCQTE
jgi:hypothetical protein